MLYSWMEKIIRKIVRDEIYLTRIRDSQYKTNTEQRACEVCGCLVQFPIQGKSEIRTRMHYIEVGYGMRGDYIPEEYIYKPSYCKIHVPKEEIKVKEV
jgi:hypothetical protein